MRALGVTALLLVLAVGAARGEIVVLVGGDVLKVVAFEVEGQRVRLDLPSGGQLVLPLRRIERIVADEIVAEPAALPAPRVSLAFDSAIERPSTPYGELIYSAAKLQGLNPEVVAAVVAAESAFDSEAVSHKGARGLMQLMPATAERFGVGMEELFEPHRNLEAGTRYLRWLTDRFEGELTLVLAAYNAGEGAVDRYGGVPPYSETRAYVRRVLARLGVDLEGAPTGG